MRRRIILQVRPPVGIQKSTNKAGRPRKGSLQNSIWNLYTERHLLWFNKCTTNIPKGGTSGSMTAAPKIPKGAGKLPGQSLDRN